jgi:FtsP/CotA-like multicopper oxidase with cupredoxin domain
MPSYRLAVFMVVSWALMTGFALASSATDICPRPATGASVAEPEDLRSQNGELKVQLEFHQSVDANGAARFCYLDQYGHESPNLRVHPGDLLTITLKNDLPAATTPMAMAMPPSPASAADQCAGLAMTGASTNLHFHGLSVPPICHQDDVIRTSIEPGDPPFEYHVRIPLNQPPGLYWYHPHLHGFSKAQVLGGASGALIIEGMENVNRAVAGLQERVIVIRDQDLMNPNANPPQSGAGPPAVVIRDREGDAVNTGDGTGKPAKDLSINFVPVPFPSYPPATIKIKPLEQQLWRVLNASAITYLNLQILVDGMPQILGVVAVDGVPLNQQGKINSRILWEDHVGLAPAGRMEFLFKGPPGGMQATLVTRSVNTGPGGENDPTRPLATIVAALDAPEPRSALSATPVASPAPGVAWLGDVNPVRTRKLYFSEKLQDPNDPNSPTTFYLTEEGQTPKPFDPNSRVPNIVVHQGDVEDWIIENRSQELHDFHIHQVHYLMLEWNGLAVNEPFLRDTVNVPFWDGKSSKYPSVRLRIDFRDPNIVGTFPYHCHLLEHEDGGMMGLIRVEPRDVSAHRPDESLGAQ